MIERFCIPFWALVPTLAFGQPAVTPPVMRDHAEALRREEQHLRVPVICAERPAMVKMDRLRILRPPILEIDLHAVIGCHKTHSITFPLDW